MFRLCMVSICLLLTLTKCSQDSGGTSETTASGPADFAAMPAATGPVDLAAGAAFRGASRYSSDLRLANNTGIKVKEWPSQTWTSEYSGAMCNVGNMANGLFREAASVDRVMCHMGAGEKNKVFTPTYDAQDYYLSFSNGMKVKYNVTKTFNEITSFKMWVCGSDGGGGAVTNAEYVDLTTVGGIVTLTSVGAHSSGGYSGSQRTTATGTIDRNGRWATAETITHYGKRELTGGATFVFRQQMDMTRYSDRLSLKGAFTATIASVEQTGRFFAMMQLLNSDSLDTIAFGGGSAKFTATGVPGGITVINAWDSDTRKRVTSTSGDYYRNVSVESVADAAATSTIDSQVAFAASETWDCTVVGTPTAVDMAAFQTGGAAATDKAACDTKYLGDAADNNLLTCKDADYSVN